MADKTNELEIDGFEFCSKKDILIAQNELKGIEYLKKKTNMKNPRAVLTIYNKLVNEGLFYTPIGINYLKELQKFLIENNEIDNNSIANIPVKSFDERVTKKNLLDNLMQVFGNSSRKYKERLKLSAIINIILIIVIISMFIITKTSNNVNVINYERKLIDKYSSWEQDLTARENALRDN